MSLECIKIALLHEKMDVLTRWVSERKYCSFDKLIFSLCKFKFVCIGSKVDLFVRSSPSHRRICRIKSEIYQKGSRASAVYIQRRECRARSRHLYSQVGSLHIRNRLRDGQWNIINSRSVLENTAQVSWHGLGDATCRITGSFLSSSQTALPRCNFIWVQHSILANFTTETHWALIFNTLNKKVNENDRIRVKTALDNTNNLFLMLLDDSSLTDFFLLEESEKLSQNGASCRGFTW